MRDTRAGSSRWAGGCRRLLVPARDAFRMYRGTAILLAITASAIVAVCGPEANTVSRLSIATIRGSDLGLHWSGPMQSPADSQARSLGFFGQLLTLVAAATFVVGALSLLTLYFARASAREGEIAVRRAVGASRRNLYGVSLLEGLLLATGALATGGLVGRLIGHVAAADWPGSFTGWPASLWSLGVPVAGVILAGALLPTLFARREKIQEAEATPTAFFAPALIQLALSLIALTAGALLIRHVDQTLSALPRPLASGTVWQLDSSDPSPRDRSRDWARLLDRLAAIPGLSGASLAGPGTNVGLGPVSRITTDCGDCAEGLIRVRYKRPLATHQFVSPDSFRILGMRIVAGRGFERADDWTAPRVAVVSRAMAEANFQQGQAVGRQLQLGFDQDAWYTVVGIVDEPEGIGFGAREQPPFTLYLSILQQPANAADLLIPDAWADQIEPLSAMVRESLGASAAVRQPVAMASLARAETAPVLWLGRWLSRSGRAMLLIAVAGLFSFVRLWVLSLEPELGVRRAVGATRRGIIALVVRRAAQVGVLGVLLGLWFGPGVWSAIGDVVPGVASWNASALASAAAVLVTTMLLGAFWPAWRASRRAPASLIASTGA